MHYLLRFTLLIVMFFSTNLWADELPLKPKSKSLDDFITVEIFKSKSCNCCNKYAKILRNEGIVPLVRNTDAVRSIYLDLDIEQNLRSCHLTVSNGYFFSGHVPPEDIKAVLETKPQIRGLLEVGMQPGTPGMESARAEGSEYKIYSLDFHGKIKEFNTHKANAFKESVMK